VTGVEVAVATLPDTALAAWCGPSGPEHPKLAVILSKFDALQALSDVEGSE
jgi:hypothetical protein